MEAYDANYAKYYDFLTQHKDYGKETQILSDFLGSKGYGQEHKILSVGCGTGSHEKLLAPSFRKIVGIDSSPHMIRSGQLTNHQENLTLENLTLKELVEGDFDIAISLFNVINCVETLDDLKSFMWDIEAKLSDDGLLIFEVWNAEEVIRIPPTKVEREYKDGNMFLRRIATPVVDEGNSLITLKYEVSGHDEEQAVNIVSVHNIYLYTARVIEQCLKLLAFQSIDWYSALSEGMIYGDEDSRMLLCCASKKAT